MKSINELPKISESEWQVMEILWAESPMAAFDIIEKLDHPDWNPKTIKTLLFRLVKKGALTTQNQRREYLYTPCVEKKNYVKEESQSFLKKLFNGATAPMMAHFVKNQKLSSDEISQIRSLLDEIERKNK